MERFIVDGDVVLDQETGLEWQRVPTGPMTWGDAVAYAESPVRRTGGWKLPTPHQLFSLVDLSRYNPASLFPGESGHNSSYWSSTKDAVEPTGHAWSVDFCQGVVTSDNKGAMLRVRCVRERKP